MLFLSCTACMMDGTELCWECQLSQPGSNHRPNPDSAFYNSEEKFKQVRDLCATVLHCVKGVGFPMCCVVQHVCW